MKESLLIDVFWHAGFFLALSALIIPLLRYLKVPAALGYLLAGIALGPHGLSTISEHLVVLDLIGLQDAKHVKILAELGIVLLLFVVGLEITPTRLWQMRSLVFGLGSAQVLVTAFVIGGIAYFWGNNAQVSLLLGLGLALSSTAIVVQWLHEQKLFVTHTGRTSFSILLFQDLAVIPILLLLTIMSADAGDSIVQFTFLSLFKMIFTALIIFVVGRIVLKPLFIFANRNGGPEVFMALSLLVIVVSASVAALAGLSMALGAFIAGLLLADTEYRHEISFLVIPFKSMLLGIFFLSFGMGINLYFVAEKPFWLFSSVIGLVCIKTMVIFLLCRLWKQSTAISLETALLLSHAGEFGLLVVGSASIAGLMEENVAQFMLLNVGLTMMLAPLLAPFARMVGSYVENKNISHKLVAKDIQQEKEHHIVILGFGRIGQSIANTLCREGFEILGFDKNTQIVHEARKKMSPVFLGDVTKKSTLEAANLNDASCIVVTIDDASATQNLTKTIRNICKSTPIVVRAYSHDDLKFFEGIEGIDALAEDTIVSASLSERVLKNIGIISEKQTHANTSAEAAE